jgi:hypothetical protein
MVVGQFEMVVGQFSVSPSTGSNRDHYPQADFPVLIRTVPNWIASESPTNRELIGQHTTSSELIADRRC